MNTLLDFAGSLIYLVFMTFLLPILMVLYTLLGLYQSVLFAVQQLRQVPHLVTSAFSGRHLFPAWLNVGYLRRRLAGVPA